MRMLESRFAFVIRFACACTRADCVPGASCVTYPKTMSYCAE